MQQSCDNFYHFRKTGLNNQDSTKKENGKQYQPKKVVSPLKLERFSDVFTADERHSMYMRAQGFARNVKTQADNLYRNFPRFEEEVAAHENELHLKIIFSLACILFLFIGAPMGAIIRKGGFGWPIFISFSFFMGFFVLHLTGERLATGLVWPTWMGSWLPIWSLFPIAVLLTVMAMNDSRALPLGFIRRLFRKKKQSLE